MERPQHLDKIPNQPPSHHTPSELDTSSNLPPLLLSPYDTACDQSKHRDSGCFPELATSPVSEFPVSAASIPNDPKIGVTESMVSQLHMDRTDLAVGARNPTPPMDIPGSRSSSQSSSHSDYISFVATSSNPSSSLPCTAGACPLSSTSPHTYTLGDEDSYSEGSGGDSSPVFTISTRPSFRGMLYALHFMDHYII